jgi:hypothetical protein
MGTRPPARCVQSIYWFILIWYLLHKISRISFDPNWFRINYIYLNWFGWDFFYLVEIWLLYRPKLCIYIWRKAAGHNCDRWDQPIYPSLSLLFDNPRTTNRRLYTSKVERSIFLAAGIAVLTGRRPGRTCHHNAHRELIFSDSFSVRHRAFFCLYVPK